MRNGTGLEGRVEQCSPLLQSAICIDGSANKRNEKHIALGKPPVSLAGRTTTKRCMTLIAMTFSLKRKSVTLESGMSVAELKEECRVRELPVSGTKDVLRSRLQASEDAQVRVGGAASKAAAPAPRGFGGKTRPLKPPAEAETAETAETAAALLGDRSLEAAEADLLFEDEDGGLLSAAVDELSIGEGGAGAFSDDLFEFEFVADDVEDDFVDDEAVEDDDEAYADPAFGLYTTHFSALTEAGGAAAAGAADKGAGIFVDATEGEEDFASAVAALRADALEFGQGDALGFGYIEDEEEEEDDDDLLDLDLEYDDTALAAADRDEYALTEEEWELVDGEKDLNFNFYDDDSSGGASAIDAGDVATAVSLGAADAAAAAAAAGPVESTPEEQQRQKRLRKLKKAIKLIEKLKAQDYLKLTNDQRAKLQTEPAVIEELAELLIPGVDPPLPEILLKVQPAGRIAVDYVASDLEDMAFECAECNKGFVFAARDQAFYLARGFDSPTRCPACRVKKANFYAAQAAASAAEAAKPSSKGKGGAVAGATGGAGRDSGPAVRMNAASLTRSPQLDRDPPLVTQNFKFKFINSPNQDVPESACLIS
ncbi:hypothetical protein JKP88DRAFT_261071 [Tribonema minus]|uniref:SAP domain-containing protein n=1 Tax=Tribonema minus TaxID=303371 RepID=A0A835YXF5_9STRA|nr:hypothetical protein JKP88DRAFT_261071 [Tribonema minus]